MSGKWRSGYERGLAHRFYFETRCLGFETPKAEMNT